MYGIPQLTRASLPDDDQDLLTALREEDRQLASFSGPAGLTFLDAAGYWVGRSVIAGFTAMLIMEPGAMLDVRNFNEAMDYLLLPLLLINYSAFAIIVGIPAAMIAFPVFHHVWRLVRPIGDWTVNRARQRHASLERRW